MKPIYSTAINNVCNHLQKYLTQPEVHSAQLEPRGKYMIYTYTDKYGKKVRTGGLTAFLKDKFYKYFKVSKRRFNRKGFQKKASSRALGNRIDKELSMVVEGRQKKKWHPFTLEIQKYWSLKGYTPIAAQLPVVVSGSTRMTQADVILKDSKDRLWMHELKTGHVAVGIVKGSFAAPFQSTPCSKGNQWDLQRHFTEMSLKERGLPLYGSRVLHVYEDKKRGIIVKERPKVFKIK